VFGQALEDGVSRMDFKASTGRPFSGVMYRFPFQVPALLRPDHSFAGDAGGHLPWTGVDTGVQDASVPPIPTSPVGLMGGIPTRDLRRSLREIALRR